MGETRQPVTVQLFVDESKRHGFFMVAVSYEAELVPSYRSQLRRKLRRGQRRIHFKSERDSTRRQLIDLITAQGAQAYVFVGRSRYEPQARRDCIKAIAVFAAQCEANRLVIELDETQYESDRRILTQIMQSASARIPWDIQPPANEPMLWVADAIAWCWNHPDPRWRALVKPMVANVTDV